MDLAGAFVSALATFVFLFLAIYLTARGFDPQRIGLIVSCFGLGALVAGPLGGTLADRIGRRPMLVGALVASATFATLLGLMRAPVLVVVGVFAFGVAASSVFPALFAAAADVVPEADRPRAFGLLYWANNIGISLSAVVGGRRRRADLARAVPRRCGDDGSCSRRSCGGECPRPAERGRGRDAGRGGLARLGLGAR